MSLPPRSERTAVEMHWNTSTNRVKRERRRQVRRCTQRWCTLLLMKALFTSRPVPPPLLIVCNCFLFFSSLQDNELDGSDLDSSNDEEEWKTDSSRWIYFIDQGQRALFSPSVTFQRNRLSLVTKHFLYQKNIYSSNICVIKCVAFCGNHTCFWLDSHTSSEYSDWTADAGINLQPSTPLSSRKRVRRRLSSSEEEEEENEEEEEKQQSDEEERPKKKGKEKAKKAKNKFPRVRFLNPHLSFSLCESD